MFGDDSMGSTAANRLGSNSSTGGISGTASRGTAGGAQNHTLTEAEMTAHTHALSDSYPGVNTGGSWQNQGGGYGGSIGSIGSTGGGGAHLNVQPTLALNYMIKT